MHNGSLAVWQEGVVTGWKEFLAAAAEVAAAD